MNNNDIAAIVVSYFPEDEVTIMLLKSLSTQVDLLIFVDNGGGENVLNVICKANITVKYIKFEKNMGLGHALNKGFELAAKQDVKYVATFDQDSAPPANLIIHLRQCHEELQRLNIDCAAVGPVFFDRRETVKKYFPFYFEKNSRVETASQNNYPEKYVETSMLITSGMLVRADIWNSGIHYNEDYFVDFTDTEWCFRARSKGHKTYGCFKAEMGHALSDAPPARIFNMSFFRYSPLRRFYFFRNTVIFCSEPYVSWAWRRRLVSGMCLRFVINLFIDKKKLLSLKMMLRGIFNGLRGSSGKFIQ